MPDKLDQSTDRRSFQRSLLTTALLPLLVVGGFLLIAWWQLTNLLQQTATLITTENSPRTAQLLATQQTAQAIVVLSGVGAIMLGACLFIVGRNRFEQLAAQFEDALLNAQKQSEEAAQQREWLQGTLASIGDGVIATDIQGNVTFINRIAQSLTETSPAEAIGKPLTTVFKVVDELSRKPVVTRPEMNGNKPGVSGGNGTSSVVEQALLIGSAGRETPIENSASVIRNARDLTFGSVYVFRDLTDRRRTNARLLSSERRYRDLTNAMPLMLWTATPAGEIDYYNRQWVDFTGLAPKESKSVADWQPAIHPDDVATFMDKWQQALMTGQEYEIESRWKRASDGEYVWQLGRSVPVRDDDGNLINWIGTLTNIDKQKQGEMVLLDRTAELEYSAQRLEERNLELDQFAYITSHDLKAPLRGIANLSQWIEEDLGEHVTDEIRKQMDLLRGRVHRMEALIDGILQYSRVGRVKGAIETVNVEALLKEVIDLLAPPPEMIIRIEPGMPVLRTERLLLQQTFSNLIGNALKHRSRVDGHLTVGVKERGAFYEFSVADDGPGIPAEFHQKIFMIFQTLESRDKVEGSGLGLALVKKIVETQGGKIRLESTVGVGTTFYFTWPKVVKERR